VIAGSNEFNSRTHCITTTDRSLSCHKNVSFCREKLPSLFSANFIFIFESSIFLSFLLMKFFFEDHVAKVLAVTISDYIESRTFELSSHMLSEHNNLHTPVSPIYYEAHDCSKNQSHPQLARITPERHKIDHCAPQWPLQP
jgi:hypothetical protein